MEKIKNIKLPNGEVYELGGSGGGLGMPIGTIYPLTCTLIYVPEGSLPTDGAEYTKAQFNDLWDNCLTNKPFYFAYYAENLTPEDLIEETATIYTTSENPTSESEFYLYKNGELKLITPETFITVVDVSADKIEFWYGVGNIAEAYRDISKDLNQDLTPFLTAIPLLNTCTYEQYEADLATYGQCAKFAVDTVDETFRVPLIKDGAVIQQAMTDSELGKAYNAGLPNVEAILNLTHFTGNTGPHLTATGAFKDSTSEHSVNASGSGTSQDIYVTTFDFKASNSNPIYGNSDTVQMNAVALRYFVVVATGSINQSMMDWSEWASGLQGKVSYSDLVELPATIVETYHNGASWYNVYSNGFCEQGGFFTGVTGTYTITLLKSYANTDYSVFLTNQHSAVMGDARVVNNTNKTTSSFQIVHGSNSAVGCYWECKGYLF